ncbi:MAG TPA: tetratricopeptide repeat protein [Kofleriaceae bacterium]|nr:tetratricopeptide repeat protein [Kofleriaceae bacterium]
MPPTSLCIVARSMSRFLERVRIVSVLGVALALGVVLGGICGCEQLDGRNRIRKGNRLFRETQFVDSAAEYQRALKEVDDPIIHYNLGLAYSKIFKPGLDAPVLLGTKDEFVCQEIPGVKMVEAGACVKPGDRHYAECGAAKTGPIDKQIAELNEQLKAATDDAKKKELETQIKDKQDELNRFVCSSSFQCVETTFCALTSPELAELSAQNFQVWIKSQPNDDEIKKQLVSAVAELEEAKKVDNKSALATAQKRVDELQTKDQTRKMMTQLWIDSEQHRKALDYWESLLQDRPNDAEIMGNLAGINLKAGDWRKSIEWYNKVADVTNDPSSKVAAYQFIGNVAWSKLNSRTLIGTEAVELADRGIGALQRAAEVQPKNPRLTGLQASLFNFRSTAHGAALAAAIDRATAQDLLKLTRVLADEAKKAQGLPTGPAEAPPAENAGSGSGAATGSGAPGTGAGSAPSGSPTGAASGTPGAGAAGTGAGSGAKAKAPATGRAPAAGTPAAPPPTEQAPAAPAAAAPPAPEPPATPPPAGTAPAANPPAEGTGAPANKSGG